MSSGGMLTQKLNVDDLQFEKGTFDGTMAYAQNKVKLSAPISIKVTQGALKKSEICVSKIKA